MCPLLFVSWRISANIGRFVNKSACLYPDSGKFGNNGLYFPSLLYCIKNKKIDLEFDESLEEIVQKEVALIK